MLLKLLPLPIKKLAVTELPKLESPPATMLPVSVMLSLSENSICCGVALALVVITMLLPSTNSTVSSPTATRLVCPATCQVLNVLPNDINAVLEPRSVTLKPVTVSNNKLLTLPTMLLRDPVVYCPTVKLAPTLLK